MEVKKIETVGETKLGNCWYSCRYKIYSTALLSKEDIVSLRDQKLIGYGQTYNILKPVSDGDLFVTEIVDIVDSSD